MDPSVPKDATWFFDQLWSTLVVALVIYGGGLTANQIVMAIWPQTRDLVEGKTRVMDPALPLLFRLWFTTRLSHPFVVGAALSFVPGLPEPDFVTSHTSGALWMGFAGMGNGTVHQIVDATVRQVMKLVDLIGPWVRQRLGLPAAPPSRPPPASDPMPSTITPLADTLEPTDEDKTK